MEAYRANALFDAHRDDPEFGHRLLADEATRRGDVGPDRGGSPANGWWSAFRRGRNGKPGPPVHDDLCVIDEHCRTCTFADAPTSLSSTHGPRRSLHAAPSKTLRGKIAGTRSRG
ncbi:hypothetical protein [Corynebacterium variabile]|uniref:hypothetical protein n=1 Tax=Corynebacterium variabile TaxID=1727 RepID=UPI003A8EA0F3